MPGWGDKSKTVASYAGATNGVVEIKFTHTYADKPLTYTITVTSQTTTGNCGAANGTLQFTLGFPCSGPYKTPASWNTAHVASPIPGLAGYVEPLNVIISACSTISLSAIQAALGNWDTVSSNWLDQDGVHFKCISPEEADVAAGGYATERTAWRLVTKSSTSEIKDCLNANQLSFTGDENHVRIWNHAVSGSSFGAWFITASYETACVSVHGSLKPFQAPDGSHRYHTDFWHCVDGGPGSYHARHPNGYEDGAKDFAAAVIAAAQHKGWKVTEDIVTRSAPAGHNTGEDGVSFNGTVYVLTVT